MSATVYRNADELIASRGVELGPSDWMLIDQAQITAFGEATGDMQWIHVDPVRAADGPYGGTIAHGFLTLSLVPIFMVQLRGVKGTRLAVNYGLEKVRFPAPVPVGGRVRASMVLVDANFVPDGALHTVTRVTLELEGSAKPVCVADFVMRLYFEADSA